MRNTLIAIGVAAVLIVGGFTLTRGRTPAPPTRTDQPSAPAGPRLPDLALTDYDGRTVRFTDLIGKPLVVNSWAVWCTFCRKELPDFAAVQREFGDRVMIVAVDRAEPAATAKAFSDELGITQDLRFLLDPSDSFYRAIGGFSMPETIFVDRAGIIREHRRGVLTREALRAEVQRLIDTER